MSISKLQFQQAKQSGYKITESVFTLAQQSLCFPGYHNDSVFLTTTRVTSRRPGPHRQGGQERLQRRRRGPHLLRGVDSTVQQPTQIVTRLATCRHGSGSSDLACGLRVSGWIGSGAPGPPTAFLRTGRVAIGTKESPPCPMGGQDCTR